MQANHFSLKAAGWFALFLLGSGSAAPPLSPSFDFRYFEETTLRRELTEASLMFGLLGTDLYLKTQKPWFDKPLLPTKLASEPEEKVSEDVVPISTLNFVAILPGSLILLLPNENGFFTSKSWRHSKGFVESVYILSPLVTDVAKLTVGKKRPNYNSLTAEGKEPVGARKSFWSLHSATAFGMTTYANLYLFQHYGGGFTENLFWKIPFLAASYTLASLVAASRDYNRDHDDLDISVGGIFGSLMALGVYGAQEGWWLNLYPGGKEVTLTPQYGGAQIAIHF